MPKPARSLHLGCGLDKIPGAIGLDINPRVHPDIVHDLDRFPYPFRANSFDAIYAINVLEHVEDFVKVMEEIYRICRPHAKIYVTTCHFSSVDSFTDPTHKRFFATRTFDYFVPGRALFSYHYSVATFKINSIVLGPKSTSSWPLLMLLRFINHHQALYESRFAFIFPVGVIYHDLEVLK